MNKLLIWLIILLVIPCVFAQTQFIYQVNNSINIVSDYSNLTNANITLYNSTGGVVVSNKAMTTFSPGLFNYSYYFNKSQTYYYNILYYTGAVNQTQSYSLIIVNYLNNIAQDTSMVLQGIFTTFILFIVPFLIAILAHYIRFEVLFIFSGIWFMGSSADIIFTGQSWSTWIWTVLLGFILIYHGIALILERNERNKLIKETKPDFETYTELH